MGRDIGCVVAVLALTAAAWTTSAGQQFKPGKLPKEEIAKLQPGLTLRFYMPGNELALDARRVRLAALHVPEGSPHSALLPPGRFEARFSGLLKLDLKGEYTFKFLGSGDAVLRLNNQEVVQMKDCAAKESATTPPPTRATPRCASTGGAKPSSGNRCPPRPSFPAATMPTWSAPPASATAGSCSPRSGAPIAISCPTRWTSPRRRCRRCTSKRRHWSCSVSGSSRSSSPSGSATRARSGPRRRCPRCSAAPASARKPPTWPRG